jgi:uncharacterized protein YabN with tetrapyrrole methylase and pyrophosphatase domain
LAEFGSAAWVADALDAVALPAADIYLVGTGQRCPDDLSLAAISAMRRSRRIFALPPVSMDGLDLPEMVDLRAAYGRERLRRDTYREMADVVLAAALADPPVSFLTFGSAMVGALPAHTVLAEAPAAGLRLHVCAAPSFVEGIWAELNVDPFDGVLIWDATAFLASGAAPPTTAHLLLAQPAFLDRFTARSGATESAVGRLRDRLLQHYDAGHRACFVRVAESATPTATEWTTLGALTEAPNDLSSLFVPRCEVAARLPDPASRGIGRQVTTTAATLDLAALRQHLGGNWTSP